MNHPIRAAAAALLCALVWLLPGCASTPCPTDWQQAGQADGAAGRELREFASRARDCRREGKATDENAYARGWELGNRSYCTRTTGEAQGGNGQAYAGACQGNAEYFAGWSAGLDRHCTAERGQAAGARGDDALPLCIGRNRDSYGRGHAGGLLSYCVAETGWQAGFNGRNARGVCRGVNDDAYLRGHRLGTSARETQNDLDELGRRIKKLEDSLAATTDERARATINDQLREARRDQRQLREQLTRLQVAR
jgi:hypothetical protein